VGARFPEWVFSFFFFFFFGFLGFWAGLCGQGGFGFCFIFLVLGGFLLPGGGGRGSGRGGWFFFEGFFFLFFFSFFFFFFFFVFFFLFGWWTPLTYNPNLRISSRDCYSSKVLKNVVFHVETFPPPLRRPYPLDFRGALENSPPIEEDSFGTRLFQTLGGFPPFSIASLRTFLRPPHDRPSLIRRDVL